VEANLIESLWTFCDSFLQSIYSLLFSTSMTFERTGTTVYYKSNASSTIGEGAFSTVLQAARAFESDHPYALKRMLIQSNGTAAVVETEIEAYGRFQHKNILQLIDHSFFTDGHGLRVAWLLFPRAKRGSLRDLLGAVVNGRAPRPPLREVLAKFVCVCEALNVLHSFEPSYVHQDVKPDNIMIGDDGMPVLMDLGSVRTATRHVRTRKDELRISEEAAEFCTASYRAPELYTPPRGGTLDTRTDVWSAGCLLFAWWFGASPFECEFGAGDALRVVDCSYLRMLAPIPRPRERSLPEDQVLLEIVEWVLERDMTVRPFTSDLVERVKGALSGGEGSDNV